MRVPGARRVRAVVARTVLNRVFKDSSTYWRDRYRRGGTSGAGSAGELAHGKADVINEILKRRGVRSVIEFGCGDGTQLGLGDYATYVGLDVSPEAIRRCIDRYQHDPTKSFFQYEPSAFHDRLGVMRADLAMSLDVLYHLTEDAVFDTHLVHLFGAGERFVLVFSDDVDRSSDVAHIRHRRFTPVVAERFPDWRLVERHEHPLAGDAAVPETALFSSFFLYERAHPDSTSDPRS